MLDGPQAQAKVSCTYTELSLSPRFSIQKITPPN